MMELNVKLAVPPLNRNHQHSFFVRTFLSVMKLQFWDIRIQFLIFSIVSPPHTMLTSMGMR